MRRTTLGHYSNRKMFFLTMCFAKIPVERGARPEEIKHTVKCPKCGFESVRELSRCAKCGCRLASPPGGDPESQLDEPSIFSAHLAARSSASPDLAYLDVPVGSDLTEPLIEENPDDDVPVGDSLSETGVSADGPAQPSEDVSPVDSDPWREELSERIDRYRRRRGRSREYDPGTSLDLDFRTAPGAASDRLMELPAIKGGKKIGPAPARLDDWSLGPLPARAGESGPRDVLEDETWIASWVPDFDEAPAVKAAPLGRRFWAAVADALVLLGGSGVFAAIFYGVGGRFSERPADLAVIGFILVLMTLVYFAAFTALVSSTPGLLLMGLEVRTVDGASPTATDSLLRALGYLVSASALMLGFVWALVDSDGLTWHDRMSGTCVAERDWEAEPRD